MIAIKESGEELVDISKYCPEAVNLLEPRRLNIEKHLYLRETVAKMLAKAHSLLPEGITFAVTDTWRPHAVQQRYFDEYLAQFRKQFPDWNEQKLIEHTGKFAINPQDARRAGHLTGAAVDLTLYMNGRRLPMKSSKLEFSKRAETDYPQLQASINANRQLLKSVMTKAGFINYPKEYWHYSYGDVMWAELTSNDSAIYGPVDKSL